MNRRICDYCGEPWPRNNITLTRKPNDEAIEAELCDVCLHDIYKAGQELRDKINQL